MKSLQSQEVSVSSTDEFRQFFAFVVGMLSDNGIISVSLKDCYWG